MKKINFKLILKKIRESSAKDAGSSMEMLFMSYSLLSGILDSDEKQFDEELIKIAKHNFVVNLVTTLEIYFKQRILSKTDWEETAYDQFHLEQITINQAFTAFKSDGNISREILIAQSQSFQNFESIDQIFSALTNKKFFKEIGEVKINTLFAFPAVTFDENFPSWKDQVRLIFETRHKFIHEVEMSELTEEKLEQYFNITLVLISAVELYLDQKSKILFDLSLGVVLGQIIVMAFDKKTESK